MPALTPACFKYQQTQSAGSWKPPLVNALPKPSCPSRLLFLWHYLRGLSHGGKHYLAAAPCSHTVLLPPVCVQAVVPPPAPSGAKCFCIYPKGGQFSMPPISKRHPTKLSATRSTDLSQGTPFRSLQCGISHLCYVKWHHVEEQHSKC